MKKYGAIALMLLLSLSMCACRRKDNSETTVPPETATRPVGTVATAPVPETTMPMLDPTVGTNIPDPTVESNSTTDMNGDMTDATEHTTPSARGRRGLMK